MHSQKKIFLKINNVQNFKYRQDTNTPQTNDNRIFKAILVCLFICLLLVIQEFKQVINRINCFIFFFLHLFTFSLFMLQICKANCEIQIMFPKQEFSYCLLHCTVQRNILSIRSHQVSCKNKSQKISYNIYMFIHCTTQCCTAENQHSPYHTNGCSSFCDSFFLIYFNLSILIYYILLIPIHVRTLIICNCYIMFLSLVKRYDLYSLRLLN